MDILRILLIICLCCLAVIVLVCVIVGAVSEQQMNRIFDEIFRDDG